MEKSEKINKTATIIVRMKPEEKEHLKAFSEEHGVTISNLVRELVFAHMDVLEAGGN